MKSSFPEQEAGAQKRQAVLRYHRIAVGQQGLDAPSGLLDDKFS